MSIENSINTLALAIESLADAITRDKRTPAPITIVKHTEPAEIKKPVVHEMAVILMDDAGVPSKFKSRCSRCGELGRNVRTCKPTTIDGSYHWMEERI